ncbi:hypothetical protein BZM27_33095 [Paraburkholderia steynii]|uniref:Uncharacterized protein n=1 Tax=Paraburkholderia steynii TaxID=1245441 RepID=A0A4R0XCS8_9BURK|nr:hypothetical protein BZM27_33095 [Paraburkholderia steynii]
MIARNLQNFAALSESFCVLTRFTNLQNQRNPREFCSTILRNPQTPDAGNIATRFIIRRSSRIQR